MPDEENGRRGDAAWKEQRDAIAQRNADARKRAQAGLKQRAGARDDGVREASLRERADLEALNARIDKQRRTAR